MKRVFVLGFDGIPWHLVRNWSKEGELVNFREFFESGAAGPLRSTTPPITALAWPTLFCGVSPDTHGVYTLRKLSSDYSADLRTATDVKPPALWDMLTPSVVANVPMTYPVREIEGCMVSGMMTPGTEREFTYPPELAEDIRSEIPDYKVGLSYMDYYGKKDKFLADLASLLDARRALMQFLMRNYDPRLFYFVYTAPDRLQHLIWDETILLDHYKKLDKILGEVIEYTRKRGDTLYVVSDHGFGPIDKFVHVNAILRREGYLTPKREQGVQKLLGQVGLTKSELMGLLERTGLKDPILHGLPQTFVDKTARKIPGDRAEYDIDYSNTQAFVRGFGNLYINDTERFDSGTVPSSEKDQLKHELRTVLTGLSRGEPNEDILSVHDGKELFPSHTYAPDLIVEAETECYIDSSVTDTVFSIPEEKEGGHRPTGVFLAMGQNIDQGVQTRSADVVDVVPTILHSLVEPVPENADGRVLTEIFAPTSDPAESPVRSKVYEKDTDSSADYDDTDNVTERLRGLGYIE